MLDTHLHSFGPFLIVRTLGRGGMGEVFIARTRGLSEPVAAVKRLRPDVARVPTFAERFSHESELAVRLSHPNVVGTLDVGSVDGQLYVASTLVLGKDAGLIADRLRERGQGAPAAVGIRLLVDALSGLSYVHSVAEPDGSPLMLVHRDVTPGNLLVGYDGVVQVADFGLAKSLLTEQSKLTQHGEILGTPHYLAPEVIRGDRASRVSDLYGLGAVLYRFLTGVAPHQGTTAEVLLKVLSESPRPLSELRPDLPDWLVDLVHGLLDKDPARRPADAAQLAEELVDQARADGLFVPRSAVGQWLIDLFAAEYADEIEEYDRIATMEPDESPGAPEGTVVLARPVEATRLHAASAFLAEESDEHDGTELDLAEESVRAALGPPTDSFEGEVELPTRAVTVFPRGGLVFEDGTHLEEAGGEEDTLDPDTREEADPSKAATQWGRIAVSEDAPTQLPGFVDPGERPPVVARADSYEPGTTSPDPDASEPPRGRRPNPNSVVVRPVADPDREPPPRSEPPRSEPPRVIERVREPARRPPDRPDRPDRPREPDRERAEVSAPKVQITHMTPPQEASGSSRAMLRVGILLALAVVLGVGIGALVAGVKAARTPEPRTAAAPNSELAARYLGLKEDMEGRLARSEPVPVRVQRLASDAATALLQGDDASARLYLDEMERLLGEAGE